MNLFVGSVFNPMATCQPLITPSTLQLHPPFPLSSGGFACVQQNKGVGQFWLSSCQPGGSLPPPLWLLFTPRELTDTGHLQKQWGWFDDYVNYSPKVPGESMVINRGGHCLLLVLGNRRLWLQWDGWLNSNIWVNKTSPVFLSPCSLNMGGGQITDFL